MDRLFTRILFVSMILLLGFQAWGEPQPKTLVSSGQESVHFTLGGDLFGDAPEIGLPGKIVSSPEGLKGCVLLADSPVLDNCGHLEILSVQNWGRTTITFVPGAKVSDKSKHLFIFVMDGEGKVSLPVGPLEIVDGLPVVDPLKISLGSSTMGFANGDTVKVLKLFEGPGIPGQPGQPMIE